LDPRTGAQTSFWPWPPTEKTDHEVPIKARPGNLLVTSEQVIVLNDDELAGYSKWETARDNRLKDIKASPADPEAYLALAEISFRTKHYDLAQENMKRSVEVANAAAAVPGGPLPEILSRLYRINLDFAQQLLNDPEIKARDLSRFYYDQCKLSARGPEQQAEWRLCMSELSLVQDKPDEAATLYSDVLTDPSLRQASFHRVDDLARAGVVAEDKFRALIAGPGGPAVYKRFEDQAQSMLNQARANRDSKLLKQVVDGYPNSASAVAAATDLASAAREAHDIPGQLKALYWMLPRVTGDKLAAVTADTAIACLALPKPRYSSAIAWTERGLRQFKNFQWTDPDTHATMTFASLREKLRATPAAALVEGRLPVLPSRPQIGSNGQPKVTAEGKPVTEPDMQDSSLADPLALGALLAPVEQSPALRRPDLLFTEHRGRIHIFDTAHGVELTSPEIASGGGNIRDPGGLSLGNDQPAVLLGCVGDTAIFAQSDAAVAVNVKSLGIAWRVDFAGAGDESAAFNGRAATVNEARLRLRAAANAPAVMIVNGMVIDRRTGQPYVNSPPDPEAARQASFASLGRPAFSTLRIVNDKLISVTGDKVSANNIIGGKLLWSKPVEVAGNVSVALGNEDVIVAQVDNNSRAGSTFVTFDTGTGAVLKKFRMKDGERVEWRGISDDGVFFVATNLGLVAYDLLNNESRPIWRREGMTSSYPAATAITLDGLLFLKDGKDLLCLSSETGDIIWPHGAPLDVGTAVANGTVQTPFIRSVVDGDSVIFQSSGWLKEYQTTRDVQDHMLWESAEIQPGDSPPMESFQVADPDVVVMEAGPKGNNMEHTVNLVLYARDGGKMKLKRPIERAGSDGGPNIVAWEVVDNGIAMETDRQPNDPNSGKVYFYRGNKTAPKPE
jgi:outer membrane protein assembly factor BamB